MKASTERKVIRWFHILASIPVIGLIYGPVSEFPQAVNMIRWVIFPLIVMSGFWLWLGPRVKKWYRNRFGTRSIVQVPNPKKVPNL